MARDSRKPIRDASSLDDSTPLYIEVNSPGWRDSEIMDVRELFKKVNRHLKIDPKTLKVQVPEIFEKSFLLEKYDNYDVSYYLPPQNKLEVKPLIAAIDDNYLYIWVEKQKKWKRIPLSSWDLEE